MLATYSGCTAAFPTTCGNCPDSYYAYKLGPCNLPAMLASEIDVGDVLIVLAGYASPDHDCPLCGSSGGGSSFGGGGFTFNTVWVSAADTSLRNSDHEPLNYSIGSPVQITIDDP